MSPAQIPLLLWEVLAVTLSLPAVTAWARHALGSLSSSGAARGRVLLHEVLSVYTGGDRGVGGMAWPRPGGEGLLRGCAVADARDAMVVGAVAWVLTAALGSAGSVVVHEPRGGKRSPTPSLVKEEGGLRGRLETASEIRDGAVGEGVEGRRRRGRKT